MPQPLVTENAKHIVDKEIKEKINIDKIFFEELLYVKTKVSSLILNQLKEESFFILENQDQYKKYNSNLAGNIEKEFGLNIDTEKILFPTLSNLAKAFVDDKNSSWEISTTWINFQKKYEFNPVHTHSGDLSFVLWVQIPYDLENELSFSNCKYSNMKENSLFVR